jgi:hypothetical protein
MQGLVAVPARLVGLALVALVAAAPAAFSAGAPSHLDGRATSGFAGPVTTRPRPLDIDLSQSAGTLREVRCATAVPGARCWVER